MSGLKSLVHFFVPLLRQRTSIIWKMQKIHYEYASLKLCPTQIRVLQNENN